MELKDGYKKTDIGIIPVDWEVVSLKSLCCVPMQNGVFYKPSSKGKGVRLVNVGDLYRTTPIDVENLELFDATDEEKKRFKVENGDLFFTRSSVVPSGIAHCNIYQKIDSGCVVFDSHIIRIRSDFRKVDAHFLYRFCLSKVARTYLVAHSKTATMTTIDQGVLGKCPVVLPTKKEQKAIAEVLSDTDNLIRALEKRIAKKCLIKQGAMQKLLTPKEDWEVKKLGEICDVRDGTHQTPNYVEIGIPFYSVENVTKNDFKNTKFISESEHNFLTKNWKIEKGDILMTRIGSIGDCKFINWNVNASFYVSLALLKMKKGFSGQFLTQYSNSEFFKKEIELNSLSSAIPKKINLGQISNVKVIIPLNYEEQTHIATILSDMDSEIEALEKKRAKYKLLKQGLMQNLLTGKIRLI
ncbi:MAG: restriction endonuclease subunit S [Candidatus Parabeggiatoa sp. nov. 2]|nr:MAG: restriction endonuclease subunit S [Gammaproteobacteria bacterium]